MCRRKDPGVSGKTIVRIVIRVRCVLTLDAGYALMRKCPVVRDLRRIGAAIERVLNRHHVPDMNLL